MDATSFISKYKKYINYSILVLNSTSEVKKIIEDLKQYTRISLWLDNDNAGNVATEFLLERFPKNAVDHREKIKPFNDVNDWILGFKYTR